ncbi:hypothetical protein HEMROJRC1_01260 [Rodentibacter sp. JRC1]|nr:hypothetical protein HEMROJRC1_01260 [Rodentibacter sp. JRC1]
MQINNLLYQQTINFAKRQNFGALYLEDIKSLKDTGYVVSTINIDRTLPNLLTSTALTVSK